MPRFGKGRLHSPKIQKSLVARMLLKIFGNMEITSSHFHFMRNVRRLKKKYDFKRILDAGSGNGDYAFWVAERFPDVSIDACDVSEDSINLCKNAQKKLGLGNIDYIQMDLREFIRPGTYDFIYSNHVLEHIPENLDVIKKLVTSLKPGGYIYIQLPDADQKRLDWGEKYMEEHKKWADKEHIGLTLNLKSLSGALRESGCEIIRAKHTEGVLGEISFKLGEMARSYYRSNAVFALMLPFLKIIGYLDSLMDYKSASGILVLARKTND
ncbi:MAG: methyltransferase domain-containing protein [candidate division Zixibacteria bacterium]|nr:methyltransferase domain-containing protein [candidate division Zixibacteria bacterium]